MSTNEVAVASKVKPVVTEAEAKEQKLTNTTASVPTSGEIIPEKKSTEKSHEAVSIKMPSQARRGGRSNWATLCSKRFILGFFKWMPFETKKQAVLWFEGALLVYSLTFVAVNYCKVDDANDILVSMVGTKLNEMDAQIIKDIGTALPIVSKVFKYLRYACIAELIWDLGSFWLLVAGILGAGKWKLVTWVALQFILGLVSVLNAFGAENSDDLAWVFVSPPSFMYVLVFIMRVLVIRLIIDIIAEFKKREQKAAAAGDTDAV